MRPCRLLVSSWGTPFLSTLLIFGLVSCGGDESGPTDPKDPTAPTAEFVGVPTSGTAPLTVAFADQSSGGPSSWSWTFGDGGSSSEQDPTHVYQTAGSWSVGLSASNSAGQHATSKTDYITVTTVAGETPVLDEILPPGVGVGMTVTLYGQHFGSAPKRAGAVIFGSVAASSYQSWSDTEIEVVVPTLDPPSLELVEVKVVVEGRESNGITFHRQPENTIRLTKSRAYEWQPYWGSNSLIYFASNATGNFNIWYMDAGGGDPVQRTFFSEGQTDLPAYSIPNLYYRSNHDGDWDIYVSSGPGNEGPITNTPEKDFEVVIAPDRAPYRIALSRAEEHNGGTNWNIYGFGSTGFGQISDNHADFHPTFSPNGQQVAYMYKFGDWDPGQIMVVSVYGGESTLVTDPEENCAYPTWNPVYDVIAYTRSEGGRRQIFMIHPDGTGETQLSFAPFDIVYPHWAPDGKRLAYASFIEGSYELFVIDVHDKLTGL